MPLRFVATFFESRPNGLKAFESLLERYQITLLESDPPERAVTKTACFCSGSDDRLLKFHSTNSSAHSNIALHRLAF